MALASAALAAAVGVAMLGTAAGCKYARCGNGVVEAKEKCDDGNDNDTDGCLQTCEPASCGDGFVFPTQEACDVGVDNDGRYGGCSTVCTLAARCGDGTLDLPFEECDAGADNADSGSCTRECKLARCGDALIWAGREECDDGYADACGTCNAFCTGPGAPAVCSDGIVCTEVEACDDGNYDNSDGCLDNCSRARCGDGFVYAGVEPCDAGCSGFSALSAHDSAVCGLRINGGIQCWGASAAGLLNAPSGSFAQLSVGPTVACGVRTDGGLVCWGAVGLDVDIATAWTQQPSGKFVEVAVGGLTACALDTDGLAHCWGPGEQPIGAPIPPAAHFVKVTVGTLHACGLVNDGRVMCWGRDSYGQATVPDGRFVEVDAGGDVTCGIRNSRELVCWGQGGGIVGAEPAGHYLNLAVGATQACALSAAERSVACWGEEGSANAAASLPAASQRVQVTSGQSFVCSVDASGAQGCAGDATSGWTNTPMSACAADCSGEAPATPETGALCMLCEGTSCTSASGGPANAPYVLACDTRALDGQCTEYSGWAWDGHSVPCGGAQGGVGLGHDGCPHTGSVAHCTSEPANTSGHLAVAYYYSDSSPSYTVATARAACSQYRGEFATE